jgi:tetratricopeptide (TPR) repeat protein
MKGTIFHLIIYFFAVDILFSLIGCGNKPGGDELLKQSIYDFNKNKVVDAVMGTQKAIDAFESANDSDGVFEARVYLAMIYHSIGQRQKAFDVIRNTKYRFIKDNYMFSMNYYRCLALYKSTIEHENRQAIDVFDKLIKLDINELPKDTNALYVDKANKAELLVMENDTAGAWKIVREISDNPTSNSINYDSEILIVLARLHLFNHDYDNTLKYANKCIEHTVPHKNIDNYSNALRILMHVDSVRHDVGSYIAHRDRLETINNKVKGDKVYFQIALLQEKSKTDAIQQRAELHKISMSFLIVIVAFLIVIVLLLYRHGRNMMKIAKIEDREKDAEIERKRLENELLMLKMNKKDEALDKAYKDNVEISIELANKNVKQDSQTHLDKIEDVLKNTQGDFLKRLNAKLPKLSYNETLIMGFTRMGMTNKEIASALGISLDSLTKSRYRLRKRLNIGSSSELNDFIENI